MQKITLSLIPSLIIEAVKGETYLKGRVDRASDDKAIALAYSEQAGDDVYHERKLQRTLVDSTEQLKTWMSDFMDQSGFCVADNSVSSSLDMENDTLGITLAVSDRFNTSFTESLAKLSARYITNSMIADWYSPINPNLAQVYEAKMVNDKVDIQRCFNKRPPLMPNIVYTSQIKVLQDSTEITELSMVVGGTATLNYTIDSYVIDDVVIAIKNSRVASVELTGKREITVTALYEGETTLVFYSKHDDSVKNTITITVTEE